MVQLSFDPANRFIKYELFVVRWSLPEDAAPNLASSRRGL
jgi:hypothetical protein